ncbi:MAG: helix-turn-helix transcriptional regulator [Clostridia bacterium]|nr:helix-turn-helix transcriptional regulator [Clostridia bacterium]
MKTVSISDIHTIDLIVKDVSVIFQTPLWSSLGGLGASHSPRKLNGFLLINSGTCHYGWVGGTADLHATDLIYLPSGAKRVVSVTCNSGFSFYRISFRLFDAADGEEIIFSNEPYVVYEVGQRVFELCDKMLITTLSVRNKLKTLSCLYEVFSSINKKAEKLYSVRVSPAINYVEKHYNENFDMSLLSDICYMSLSHLFRMFKKETGKSPLEYRMELRIERAKALLAEGECQIGEIASMLGFENIYYFSRAFKKRVGMSPSEYKRKII